MRVRLTLLAVSGLVAAGNPAAAQSYATQADIDAYNAAVVHFNQTGDVTPALRIARNWCARRLPNACETVPVLERAQVEIPKSRGADAGKPIAPSQQVRTLPSGSGRSAPAPGSASALPAANPPSQGTAGYGGARSGTPSPPAYRASTPSPIPSQMVSSASGRGPSKSYKNPTTGEDCVKINGWRPIDEKTKRLYFSNSCNIRLMVYISSPGLQTRSSGIDPGEQKMYFGFYYNTYSPSSMREWDAQWSWRVE